MEKYYYEFFNNLLKPDEVVTIVRLKDELSSIQKDQVELKNELTREQENFKAIINNKVEAADKSTNLIFVVLLPIVLNFVYQVYRDRKDTSRKQEQD